MNRLQLLCHYCNFGMSEESLLVSACTVHCLSRYFVLRMAQFLMDICWIWLCHYQIEECKQQVVYKYQLGTV